MVPTSIHDHPDLLPSAIQLYVWYCSKSGNDTGVSWWSIERTAQALGVSLATIVRGRKQLIQAGLIQVDRLSIAPAKTYSATQVTVIDHPSRPAYLPPPTPPPGQRPLSPSEAYNQAQSTKVTSDHALKSPVTNELDSPELETHDPNAVSISETSIQVTDPTRTDEGQDQDNNTQAELTQLEERVKAQEKVKADTQAFRIRARKVTTSKQFRRWIIPLVVFVSSTTIVLQCADGFDRDVLIDYLPQLEQVAAHLWPGLRIETSTRTQS